MHNPHTRLLSFQSFYPVHYSPIAHTTTHLNYTPTILRLPFVTVLIFSKQSLVPIASLYYPGQKTILSRTPVTYSPVTSLFHSRSHPLEELNNKVPQLRPSSSCCQLGSGLPSSPATCQLPNKVNAFARRLSDLVQSISTLTRKAKI